MLLYRLIKIIVIPLLFILNLNAQDKLDIQNEASGISTFLSQDLPSLDLNVPVDGAYEGNIQSNFPGIVIVTDDNLLEKVKEIQEKTNAYFIHPFDDDFVIAGQGTLGMEITKDLPQVDHVFTGIGGGGLISGICVALKEFNPKIKIIGVEPKGANGMEQSLKKGKAITLESINTIADGLSAPFIGERNYEIVNKYLDELITVSDKEIIETMWLIFERTKLFIEPSSAASLAPIIFNKFKLPKNSNPIFILCGGNIDKNKLLEISK